VPGVLARRPHHLARSYTCKGLRANPSESPPKVSDIAQQFLHVDFPVESEFTLRLLVSVETYSFAGSVEDFPPFEAQTLMYLKVFLSWFELQVGSRSLICILSVQGFHL
jgi:hypothetical protein